MPISSNQLSRFLQSRIPAEAGFLDKIKIGYRPYICPFGELLEYIPEDSSVFDIGCGNGMFLSLVAKFRNPVSLGGIEILENLIDNAGYVLRDINNAAVISLDVFDGFNIPKEIENFKFIFLIDVLHHVPPKNQKSFLKNIYNNMSFGSVLVLKDIDASSIFCRFNKLHDFIFSGQAGHELRAASVRKALGDIGFEILEFKKKRMFVYPHFTVICKK